MSMHARFMRRAIELAANSPAHPFGAVIVHRSSGRVVAEGWNKGRLNPLLHGEIDALNRLAESRDDVSPGDLILYTTAEPCPMCMSAILWARIGAVAWGTSIRTLQRLGWDQIDILAEEVAARAPFAECELIAGVAEEACDALFVSATKRQ